MREAVNMEAAVHLEGAVNLEEVEEQKAELDLELCESLESSLLPSRRRRWNRLCSNQMEKTEGEKNIFGKWN